MWVSTKEKITISISNNLLWKIDDKIDKLNFKNRSHVIESLVWEWLKLRWDLWAIILAHDKNWDSWEYPLSIPKALIQVDGVTLIEKQLIMLQKANIERCVIAVWYEKAQIKDFLKKKKFSLDIDFFDCNEYDESQKVIWEASQILKTSKWLVMLGDNYFHNFNLTDFIHYHNTNNVPLSIVVKTIEASQGYWNVKLEGNNIIWFVERPNTKEDITFIVNAGIYLLDLDILPETSKNLKIETDFFSNFVTNNKTKAYFHNGKWFHFQNDDTLSLFT